MPNWKIHLEIGKNIAKKMNYNEKDYNSFLLGNILPDINNCYVVENISKRIRHSYTHYDIFDEPSYIHFYNLYKNKFDNPVVYGYFVHLYTDYFWNNDFYTKCATRNFEITDKEQLRILKQDDFKCYNNKFMDNTIKIDNLDDTLLKIKEIDMININESDLLAVEDFINKQKKKNMKLNFYTEKELDTLLNNSIKEISKGT